MAINPQWEMYSNEVTCEHKYFENLVVEFCDISGIEVHYYRIDQSNYDPIYGEDPNLPYYGKKITKMLMPVTGSPSLINIFGLVDDVEVNDAFIPKHIFNRDVLPGGSHLTPMVGDVIYVPWIQRLYEITWCDDRIDSGIFLAKSFIWQMSIRPYRYSSQNETADELIAPLVLGAGPTTSISISAMCENVEVEEESDTIEPYANIDTSIYGY